MSARQTKAGTSGQVFRLWFTVFAASLLTTALLFAPKLAGEHDFGHQHPESSPEHVHSLSGVLGSALQLAPPVTAERVLRVVFLLEPPSLQERGLELATRQQARAPPRQG